MPRGRDPERVHGVLLLRDQCRGHGVEVPGRAGLEERRPARRPGIQRIEQNVPLRIEKRLRIAPHLVVDHAPVASLPDLLHQIRNQHRLAGARGAGHDGVLGLGPLGVGHARDAVPARLSRNDPPHPRPQRTHAPCQLLCAHQFRAAHAFLLFQPLALVSEPGQHEGDQAYADLPAEPRAGSDGVEDPVARVVPWGVGGNVVDPPDHRVAVLQTYFLPGRHRSIADGELDFRQRQHAGGVTVIGGCRAPEHHDRHAHGKDRNHHHCDPRQLVPHPKTVKHRLPAADGVVAPRSHDHLPILPLNACRCAWPTRSAVKSPGSAGFGASVGRSGESRSPA